MHARRHRLAGAVAAGPTGGGADAAPAPSLHLAPFAPYHWLMYSQSLWFDIDHVRDALGWQPTWSNEEMLADSYDWFLEQPRQPRRRQAGFTAPHDRQARWAPCS